MTLALGCAVAAPAQVPDGSAILTAFSGGIQVIDPNGVVWPVAGLPAPLVGNANFVLREQTLPGPRTRIITGNRQTVANSPVYVYVLDLVMGVTGLSAVQVAVHLLGWSAAGTNALANQAAWIPGTRQVLLATSGIATGPTAGNSLWILDLATGTLTPVPLGPFAAFGMNAVALDAVAGTAYVAEFGAPYRVLQVPLAGPGPILLGSTAPYVPTALLWDCAGNLNVVASNAPNGAIYCMPPGGPWPAAPTVLLPGIAPNGAVLDPVTCDLLLAHVNLAAPTTQLVRLTNLVPGPAGPPLPGLGTGLEIDPNPELYFAAVPSPPPCSLQLNWQYRPFPGGRPRIGTTLTLGLNASTPPILTLIGLSFGLLPAPVPLPCGGALVLAQRIDLGISIAPNPSRVLTIPNAPILVGMSLAAQGAALDACGPCATSEGLHFTL